MFHLFKYQGRSLYQVHKSCLLWWDGIWFHFCDIKIKFKRNVFIHEKLSLNWDVHYFGYKNKIKKKSVLRRKAIPKLGCALFWVNPLNFDHQRAKPWISRFRSVATNSPSFSKRHLSLRIQWLSFSQNSICIQWITKNHI